MSAWPWLVGAGALGAYAWSRDKRKAALADRQTAATALTTIVDYVKHNDQLASGKPAATGAPLPGRWVWPIAAWNGRAPVISSGFALRSGGVLHKGADIMFQRRAGDPFVAGTPNGSKAHVMPDGIHALAASDGVVWSAMQTPRGYAVVIDHDVPGLATFYLHLDKLFIKPTARGESRERVGAGQPIGTVGFSPIDGEKLKHLHFEIWRGGHTNAIDPALHMPRWDLVVSPTRPGEASPIRQPYLALRNAGLVYRPVGDKGEAYPPWVRDLDGASGVYVIRDASTAEILYVGSSSKHLYNTLTRHFSTWRRWKGYWKGQYGEGHDPGLTYDRASVEVAIRRTKPNDALDEEARMIRRLRPRDNLLGQPALDDVPF